MGRYIEWQDVVDRYQSASKEFDQNGINSFIIGAEAEVDARLALRYDVPFGLNSLGIPFLVEDLAIDVAYYRMTWRLKEAETLRKSLDDRFKAIIDGRMLLTTSVGLYPPLADGGGSWGDKTSYPSAFGPDEAENYQPSLNWADDMESERD